MRLPPFTLVHAPGKVAKGTDDRLKELSAFKRGLQNTLASSLASGVLTSQDVSIVARDLNDASKSATVGVWDLRSWVGGLPHIIEHLNRAQSALTFFEVQASVPSGLVQNAERVAHRAVELLGRKLKPSEKKDIRDAIVDIDFFPIGHRVHKDLGVDYLIALTGAPVAGEDTSEAGQTFYTDFFCSPEGDVCLVSTEGLREIAETASRPFEMAAGYVTVSSLLTVMNPDLKFHPDTGCLFDYNYRKKNIARGLKNPFIENSCMDKIRKGNRETAEKLVRALSDYQAQPQNLISKITRRPVAKKKIVAASRMMGSES